jgi:uncharacterized protein (TIGR02611 family)
MTARTKARMKARMRRLLLTVAGWILTLVGVVLFPLPGPGLLLMAVGMALLAREYDWARRRVDGLRHRALLGAARGVVTTPKALVTVTVTLALTASGALWLWRPAQPSWWLLPGWTWLPGGFWAGVSQALSGLVTLALVAYAWRRFHRRPDLVAELEAVGSRRPRQPSADGSADDSPPAAAPSALR